MARKTAAQKAADAAADAAELAVDAAKAAAATKGADGTGTDDELEDDEQSLIAHIQAITEGTDGEQTFAMLWRMEVRKEAEYLGQIPLVDLVDNPLEVVRERHGGGRYKMRFCKKGGTFLKGTQNFRVAGPAKSDEDEEDERFARLEALLEGKNGSSGDGTNVLILEMIRQQGENARAAAEGKGGSNVAELLLALTPLLTPLVTALLEKNSSDPLEQMARMSEIMRNMREDSDPGMAGILKGVVPSLTKLVDAHTAEGAPKPPQPGAPPVTPNQPPVARPVWYPFLAPTMPQFLAWARSGSDPATSADFVVDHITDEQLEPLYAQLTAPTFLAELHQHFPDVVPHAQWFDTFLGRIVWHIDPNAVDELESTTATPEGAGGIVIT